MSHDICYGLAQDRFGQLWIGTDDGLDVYDGRSFRGFSSFDGLVSDYVIGLAIDDKDQMFLSTWGGGCQAFDIINTKFSSTKSLPDKVKNIYTFGKYILSLPDTRIQIYEAANVSSESSFGLEFSSGAIRARQLDPKKYINGIQHIKFSGNKIGEKFFLYYNPVKNIQNTSDLAGIYELSISDEREIELTLLKNNWQKKYVSYYMERSGKTYFGHDGGLTVDSSGHLKLIPLPSGLFPIKIEFYSADKLAILTIDNNGNRQAFIWDRGELTDIKILAGINNSLSDILLDKEGNLWVSSYGDGLFCLREKSVRFNHLNEEFFPDPNIFDVTSDQKGGVHLLSRDFVYHFQNQKITKKKLVSTCSKVKSEGDKVYLFCFEKYQPALSGYVLKDFEDEFFYGKGQIEIDLNKIIFNQKEFLLKPGIQWKSLADGTGNTFWVGGQDSLYQFDYQSGLPVVKIDLNLCPCGNRLSKLLQVNHVLYIGTNKCLAKLENGRFDKIILESEDEVIGINDLLYDETYEAIWVATQKGLYRFQDNMVMGYNQSTGLMTDYVKALILDSKGMLWASCNLGVNVLDPSEFTTSDFPQFNILQDAFAFDVFSISLSGSKNIIVEYELDESSLWKRMEEQKISFEDLKYGTHSVIFRTRYSDGAWKNSAVYTFKIIAPWYKTGFGLTIIFTAFVGLISWLAMKRIEAISSRNRQLNQLIHEKTETQKQLESARQSIARDFHDDLGNKMARIAMVSELLLSSQKDMDQKMRNHLATIKDDADVLYKNTKDFIWSLTPESNLLYEIDTYLCDFAENFFSELGICFDVQRDYPLDLALPHFYSRQVIMIFKEAMTNAAKHANASEVLLSYSASNDQLIIAFTDDGKGIQAEDLESKRGIANMKARAIKINGELRYLINNKRGCEISLFLKIPVPYLS